MQGGEHSGINPGKHKVRKLEHTASKYGCEVRKVDRFYLSVTGSGRTRSAGGRWTGMSMRQRTLQGREYVI
ncbi:MAG: hypothetical protein PUA47_06725 [Bacteroidales bacterium]|nr:hypothetical protein [Bacteroidales bacterium]